MPWGTQEARYGFRPMVEAGPQTNSSCQRAGRRVPHQEGACPRRDLQPEQRLPDPEEAVIGDEEAPAHGKLHDPPGRTGGEEDQERVRDAAVHLQQGVGHGGQYACAIAPPLARRALDLPSRRGHPPVPHSVLPTILAAAGGV
jgi:hypothetical protein